MGARGQAIDEAPDQRADSSGATWDKDGRLRTNRDPWIVAFDDSIEFRPIHQSHRIDCMLALTDPIHRFQARAEDLVSPGATRDDTLLQRT